MKYGNSRIAEAKIAATNGSNLWERIGDKLNFVLGGPSTPDELRARCKEIRTLLTRNCVIGMNLPSSSSRIHVINREIREVACTHENN